MWWCNGKCFSWWKLVGIRQILTYFWVFLYKSTKTVFMIKAAPEWRTISITGSSEGNMGGPEASNVNWDNLLVNSWSGQRTQTSFPGRLESAEHVAYQVTLSLCLFLLLTSVSLLTFAWTMGVATRTAHYAYDKAQKTAWKSIYWSRNQEPWLTVISVELRVMAPRSP